MSPTAATLRGETSTLLDDRPFYVATFHRNLTGEWIALTQETTGRPAAEISILSQQAVSKVDATTMDRPAWVAVSPVAMTMIC